MIKYYPTLYVRVGCEDLELKCEQSYNEITLQLTTKSGELIKRVTTINNNPNLYLDWVYKNKNKIAKAMICNNKFGKVVKLYDN